MVTFHGDSFTQGRRTRSFEDRQEQFYQLHREGSLMPYLSLWFVSRLNLCPLGILSDSSCEKAKY